MFDKVHSLFYFYLPAARHRIPIALYDNHLLTRWRDEELNFNKLDEFLNLLSSHESTKREMEYLDNGFNVLYGKESVDFTHFTDEEFDAYLQDKIRLQDDMANMDW